MRRAMLCVVLGSVSAIGFAQPTLEHADTCFRSKTRALFAAHVPQRGAQVRAAFDACFGNDVDVRGLGEADAQRYLKAVFTAAWQQPDSALTTAAMALVRRQREAGIDTLENARGVYRMLLAERRFDAAHAWWADVPGLGPAEIDGVEHLAGQAWNAYAVSADGRRLLALQSRALQGTGLLVIGHPACGFSVKAAAWMAAAGGRLTSATWLTPVDGNLQAQRIAQWNAQHPRQAMLIARHERDWPLPGHWDTPQFLWLQHGRVIAHEVGWTPAARALLLRYEPSAAAVP